MGLLFSKIFRKPPVWKPRHSKHCTFKTTANLYTKYRLYYYIKHLKTNKKALVQSNLSALKLLNTKKTLHLWIEISVEICWIKIMLLLQWDTSQTTIYKCATAFTLNSSFNFKQNSNSAINQLPTMVIQLDVRYLCSVRTKSDHGVLINTTTATGKQVCFMLHIHTDCLRIYVLPRTNSSQWENLLMKSQVAIDDTFEPKTLRKFVVFNFFCCQSSIY